MPSIRRRWRPELAAAGLTLLVGSAGVLVPALVGGPSPAVPVRPAAVVRDANGLLCPPSTAPAADGTGEYAIAIKADIAPLTLLDGWDEGQKYWVTRTTGIVGHVCGLLRLPSLKVEIAPQGFAFDVSHEVIKTYAGPAPGFENTVHDYVADLSARATASNDITGVRPDGSLDLTAVTPANLVFRNPPGSPAFRCPALQVDTNFTTGSRTTIPYGLPPAPQWTVAGTPLKGAYVGATAGIVSNDFAIPALDTALSGSTCPPAFVLNINLQGRKANGDIRYDFVHPHAAPPGEGQASGTLTITQIDQDALPPRADYPTATVPGSTQTTAEVIGRSAGCVPGAGPPVQLGAVGSFAGGGLQLNPDVAVTDIKGTFCGVATVVPAPQTRPDAKVCAQLVVPADGVTFDPVSAVLTQIPGVRSVLGDVGVLAQSFSALVCDDQPQGPIGVTSTIGALAVPQVYGTGCKVGPISAAVTGSLRLPLTGAAGPATSPPGIDVAAVQPDGNACPAGLALNTNAILRLPAKTTSGLDLTLNVRLYLQPAPHS